MKIAISGASGLVGSTLATELEGDGHGVHPLVRRPARGDREISWDPKAGELDGSALEGLDAVVHLAGESVAKGRWTDAKKRRIRDSRVRGTRLVAETLANLDDPPKTLVCASAIGYYGDRGDERLDESSRAGDGFLADVCVRWEAAAEAAREAGLRVVHLRIGMVLDPDDGALPQLLTPFRLGLGGKVGSGKQWMSWIAIDDLTAVIRHVLEDDEAEGPVNTVSPEPVRNRDFTQTLGQVLHRPTILPLPGFAARLALGEMAEELLLASARVAPRRLEALGYTFRHTELRGALEHLLEAG